MTIVDFQEEHIEQALNLLTLEYGELTDDR